MTTLDTTARPLVAVELRLCGDPALLAENGARVPIGRKALALLAYLAMEAGPHSRQQLASLLWSDADESHASMSLRQALTRLRELLGDALHSNRQSVRLERVATTTGWRCDVHAFMEAAERDPLASTVIDVGAFLLPSPVDDAPEFLHWADRTRATLARQAITSLRRAAREGAARREWSRVLTATERWLALDPAAEEAATLGMEAAFRRHDIDRGRAMFRAFESTSIEHDGASDVLDRLATLLRGLESAAALTPARGVSAVVTTGRGADGAAGRATHSAGLNGDSDGVEGLQAFRRVLPPQFTASLVERDDVWESLATAWRHVERGECATLQIESMSGGGRSRVLADVASWAVSHGATALSSTSPGSPLSLEYTVVVSLLRGALDAPALAGMSEDSLFTLSRLLPDVTARFPALRQVRAPRGAASGGELSFVWRLHEAMQTLFTLLCEDAPLVVAIDDVVWCDRESSALLQELTARTASLPVLWVLSAPDDVRSDKPHALWHRTPPHATSSMLRLPTLRLPALSVSGIETMLAEWSGIADGWAPLASRVHAVSEGLPAHVVTAIEDVVDRCNSDLDALRAALPPLPSPHRRIAARIDALAELDRELLLSLALTTESPRDGTSRDGTSRDTATLADDERAVVSVDTLSHVHGVSRLRAARVGGLLVDARLAEELPNGFRCASRSIAAHAVQSCSRLVADELRRRLQRWRAMS